MSHGQGPPSPSTQRSIAGVFGLVFGTAALAAVGVGGALVLERVDRVESRSEASARGVQRDLAGIESRRAAAIAPVFERIERTESASAALVGASEGRVVAKIDDLKKDLAAGQSREDGLRTELAALRASIDGLRQDGLQARTQMAESMARMDNVVEFHGNRLIQLEEEIREAGALALAAGPAASPAGPGNAPRAWEARLPELTDPDPGIRLDAASILAESADPEVVPYLLPLLDDDDLFVRMVVCQSLGKLDARVACPGLIERLSDESITVREAAVISLRQITKQSFGYEHDAREAERKRKADAWRAWWRRHGDDFLASST